MGLLAALCCAVFLSAKDLVSKRLSFSVDGTTSAFGSFLFMLPPFLVVLCLGYLIGVEDFHYSSKFFHFVLLRAISDTGAEWCKMIAISMADISLIAVFLSLAPLFLLITSPLITGDTLPVIGVWGVVIVVAGSLLLLRGGKQRPKVHLHGHNGPKAIAIAVLSSFLFSLNTCFDRLAVQEASPGVSGFGMAFVSCILMLPFLGRRRNVRHSLGTHWRPFLARGSLDTLFMLCKLFALQFMQAPYVAGIQKLSPLLTIVGGRVVYQEGDFSRRLVAGAIIVVGVAVIVAAQIRGQ